MGKPSQCDVKRIVLRCKYKWVIWGAVRERYKIRKEIVHTHTRATSSVLEIEKIISERVYCSPAPLSELPSQTVAGG